MIMAAVIITERVTIGGATVRVIEPGETPIDLPEAVAADLIAHGLAQAYAPPKPQQRTPPKV
jgi:hypothetical protein